MYPRYNGEPAVFTNMDINALNYRPVFSSNASKNYNMYKCGILLAFHELYQYYTLKLGITNLRIAPCENQIRRQGRNI